MEIEIIKYEPDGAEAHDILVWKHPCQDFSCKAQLIVHPSQVCIFVNEGECIPFPAGHYTLSESNNSSFKFINKLRNWFSHGQTAFHCEVYYVNMVTLQDLKFGTLDPIPIQDYSFGGNQPPFQLNIRSAGLFGAHIDNDDGDAAGPLNFFKNVVGTAQKFTKDQLSNYLKGKIVEKLTDCIGNIFEEQKLGVLTIQSKISFLSDKLKELMIPYFLDFGIRIDNFSIMRINVSDEDMAELKEYGKTIRERIADANLNAYKMNVESEALAAKRAREGYTYQQERGYDVLGDAANNQGNGGAGGNNMMGMGMGLGMGVGLGGAFGGAMGGVANQAFNDMNKPATPQAPTIKCNKCGAELAANTKFCPECGTPVPQPTVNKCSKCGADIPTGSKFCPECGTPVAIKVKHCTQCGQEIPEGSKFCPGCGAKCE